MPEQIEPVAQPDSSPAPVMEAKIASWLQTQGVILELTVASKFQSALGPNTPLKRVIHGRQYRDKDPLTSEEKYRETDVVVIATPITPPRATLSIWLIIECKAKPNQPWVFYRSSSPTHQGTRYEDAFVVRSNQDFDTQSILGLHGVSIFQIDQVPYSTGGVAALIKENDDPSSGSRNAANDSRNPVRDSILQVLSTTFGISQEVGLIHEGLIASILVPIVVTTAPMYTVALDDTGAPKVEETFRELVVTRSKLDGGNLKYVWVIHESQIDTLSSEFAACLPFVEFIS